MPIAFGLNVVKAAGCCRADAAEDTTPGTAAIDHRAQRLLVRRRARIKFVNNDAWLPQFDGAEERRLMISDDIHRARQERDQTRAPCLAACLARRDVASKMGLWVAASSWTQANMIHSAIASASCRVHDDVPPDAPGRRASKELAVSTGSGHGSTIQ